VLRPGPNFDWFMGNLTAGPAPRNSCDPAHTEFVPAPFSGSCRALPRGAPGAPPPSTTGLFTWRCQRNSQMALIAQS